MKNACINCDHCDEKRTNDKGQIRCKKFHIYRERGDWCEYHQDKELEQLFALLDKEEELQK